MADIKVTLNMDGVREILSSEEVKELLQTHVDRIAEEAESIANNQQHRNPKFYETEKFQAEVDNHDRSHGIAVGHVWSKGVFGSIAIKAGTPLISALH